MVDKQTITSGAYGPKMTKILARHIGTEFPKGYYPAHNADSLTMYALSKYVKANGLGE